MSGGERAYVVEACLDFLEGTLAALVLVVELGNCLEIFGLEEVDCLLGAVDVALIEIFGYLDQRVGGAGHGREDDDVAATVGYERSDVADSFCGSY